MAKHDVNFTLPERPLGKADIEFSIKRDNKPLGRLKVSNGTVVWVPKKRMKGFKMNWPDFDVLMQKNGTPE